MLRQYVCELFYCRKTPHHAFLVRRQISLIKTFCSLLTGACGQECICLRSRAYFIVSKAELPFLRFSYHKCGPISLCTVLYNPTLELCSRVQLIHMNTSKPIMFSRLIFKQAAATYLATIKQIWIIIAHYHEHYLHEMRPLLEQKSGILHCWSLKKLRNVKLIIQDFESY